MKFRSHRKADLIRSPVAPKSVTESVHVKRAFHSAKKSVPVIPSQVIYSKSDLVKMILDNEKKTNVLKEASPVVNVTEAIHGTYKTNFVLK